MLRDGQALCEMGVPVIAREGVNGGYSLPKVFHTPPLPLNSNEIFLLLLALSSITRLRMRRSRDAAKPGGARHAQKLATRAVAGRAAAGAARQMLASRALPIGRALIHAGSLSAPV